MSNQEESAPTPPVDRHDGFSQGPRAWWALWTKLVQWGVGNPWIVWSLVAVNLISSAAGYVYWYGDSILAAPPYFWPFVPDSPLSLIHISEPTRRTPISYAVFCLKKKKQT